MGGKSSKNAEVVMTPLKGADKNSKIIKIERYPFKKLDKEKVQHIAGGPYKGIIVHKAINGKPDPGKPDTLRDFFAYVAAPGDTDSAIKEKRQLRFWFQKKVKQEESQTDKFLQELLNPKSFPKDYIGFVKRILNLLNTHQDVRKLELEMRPARPGEDDEAYVLRTRIVPKLFPDEEGHTKGDSQEDRRILQDDKGRAEGGQIANQNSDSMRVPHGTELEGKRKHLENGIEHTGDDGGGITIHEAVTREDAAMAATTPTGTYLRHHDKPSRDSTGRGSRGSKEYPTDGDSTDPASSKYYPTQEDLVDEARQRAARDQYGAYGGAAGARDAYGEHRTPGSRSSYGSPGSQDSYDEAGVRRSYGSGAGSPEDSISADRSRLSYTSQDSTPGGSYRDTSFAKGREQRLSASEADRNRSRLARDKKTAASPYTRASFGSTFGKDTSEIHDISGGRTVTTVTTTTRTVTYGTGIAEEPGKLQLNKRGQELIWITKKQRLLSALEDAFPNVLQVQDLIKNAGFKQKDMVPVAVMLRDLVKRGLIQELEKGKWMRMQATPPTPTDAKGLKVPFRKKHDIRMVQNMPTLVSRDQPVIAIVTRLYCEKLAVDAMIENKITYVRYKTEGEGQVYTIGTIGDHKVVSTKLSRIGYEQGATTSSGNTITRMLGIFGRVEFVILVGVGGSVPGRPNNTVEVGDIVVSQPEHQGGPLYIHCTGTEVDESGNVMFLTSGWNVREDRLDNIVGKLRDNMLNSRATRGPWDQYIDEGMKELEDSDIRFYKPWSAGDTENPDSIKVHYGVIGCGHMLNRDEMIRRDFALTNDIYALDGGYHAVMESIEGNRKDSFLVIRGITDFKDGLVKKDWQPFASLAAAAYMKAVVKDLRL